MEKADVIEFFDRLAPQWDGDMIRSDKIIGTILDNAGVTEGKAVLDVACGTGVLFPDYLKRNVSDLTAIDISPKMVELARSKFPQVNVLCGDVEEVEFNKQFDCIVVYNAFPHFPEPERLIRNLADKLKPGGYLTVAHGMSREKIDSHHNGFASKVSIGLMPAEDLSQIFSQVLTVTTVISNDDMYQLVGKRT
jgi:demethylmenaquinone methyltransferase/2-methoxy-6-polyprenyl-1,4-benzoquinol methylase